MSVSVNTSTNTITIQQDGTRVIQINTLGPQGQQGLQGIQGDSIFTNISGNIWATTSSLQISNSLDLSESLIAPKITGSLLGTSSWAENALTSSFIITAQTASYILQAVSASFTILAETANTASYIITAQTASYVLNAISSSFASTASYLNILNQNLIVTGSNGNCVRLSGNYNLSPNEIIMEGLSGICTIDYLKKNGNSDRFIGTLNKNIIDSNKSSERVQFFSPLQGNRIVMWNLIKKDWSSFFVGGLIRFVRDDTIGIE
jgi:hypothetical protein